MKRTLLSLIAVLALLLSSTGCFITALPGMGRFVTFHDAASSGNLEKVKKLLDAGVNVDLRDGRGRTPLMFAMEGRNDDIVSLLLIKGADVHAKDERGCSVLLYAINGGDVKQVRFLLTQGFDLDDSCEMRLQNAHNENNYSFRGTALEAAKAKELISIVNLLDNAEKDRNRKDASSVQVKETGSTYLAQVKSDVDELPTVKVKSNKNAFAIVIGIEHYRQQLPKADYATNDAKKVSEYLTKVLGYPEENVITLLNEHATKSDFEKYFEKWLANNIEKGSTVFVYYSGHGAPDPKSGSAYLVPYDGDPSFIDQTGFSLKRMYEALEKLPAKKVMVALDSCFSGAGGRSVLAKGARPIVLTVDNPVLLSQKITVLSASGGDQISSTYEEKRHGLFTYFMLKGIKNEDVIRSDGSLIINDLFGYVKPQVERIARKMYNNEQTPQMIGKKQ